MEHIFRRRPKEKEQYQTTFYFNLNKKTVWGENPVGERVIEGDLEDLLLYILNLTDKDYYAIEPYTGVNDSKRTKQYP